MRKLVTVEYIDGTKEETVLTGMGSLERWIGTQFAWDMIETLTIKDLKNVS